MNLDDLINAEFKIYLERYQAWNDSDQADEVAEMLSAESERILKQLYALKFNVDWSNDNDDDYIGWVHFMGELGAKIKL